VNESFTCFVNVPGAKPPGNGTGPVTPTQPVTTGPTITGTAKVGSTLGCSGGSASVHGTRVVYQWVAQGRPIPGAATRLLRVRKVEEGLKVACVVTPYSGSVAGKPVTSPAVYVSAPVVSGCPTASGSLQSLLRLLGLTRAQIGMALKGSSSIGQSYEDWFCLTPAGLLVGYPPAGLLGSLPAAQQGQFAGKVLWITTANWFYSFLGIGPGTPLSTASTLVNLTGPFTVGGNAWYLAQHGSDLVVLIVRDGAVWQLGVADWSLAGGKSAELAFINALESIYQESVRVSGPLRALDDYWLAISAHDFAAAYGLVVPGALGSEAGFVAGERGEGVYSAQFEGRVISHAQSTATVRTVLLTTHDRRFGCRTWTGTYTMVVRAGRWLIKRADINPAPCRSG
jgi:hypothetical protein